MPNVTCEVLSAGSVQGLRELFESQTTHPEAPPASIGLDNMILAHGVFSGCAPSAASRAPPTFTRAGHTYRYDLAGNYLGREPFTYPLIASGVLDTYDCNLIGALGGQAVYFAWPRGINVGGNLWLVDKYTLESTDPVGTLYYHACAITTNGLRMYLWLNEKTSFPDTYNTRSGFGCWIRVLTSSSTSSTHPLRPYVPPLWKPTR